MDALYGLGGDVVFRKLETGDYLVDDSLLVERKTLADFAKSIIDGRLFRQVHRLVNCPKAVCVILEGTSKDAQNHGVSREALQGAMVTLGLIYRIPILRSLHPRETARLMLYASRQLDGFKSGVVRLPGYRPRGARKQKLYFLQGLPEVGPRRAEALLDHFGSVEAVVEADESELTAVPGIGSAAARKIRGLVREERLKYHT